MWTQLYANAVRLHAGVINIKNIPTGYNILLIRSKIKISTMSFPSLLLSASNYGKEHFIFVNVKLPPKPWHHNEEQYWSRIKVVKSIAAILDSRTIKYHNCECVENKNLDIAYRVEDALYYEASSLEEYSDLDTLQSRLVQIALAMQGDYPRK